MKNFRRAGCLSSDTDALAFVLLFRSTSERNQFKPSDTVVMRIWYDDQHVIGRIEMDYDVGLVEKALADRKSRICGENLEVLASSAETPKSDKQ